MAAILKRKRRDGSTAYLVRIRKHRGGRVIHCETQTFSRLAPAKEWATRRKVELQDEKTLADAIREPLPLHKLIRWYIDTFEPIAKWKRSKAEHLGLLAKHQTSDRDARDLTTQDLIAHVRQRRDAGAGPATVAGDLTWIGVVLRAAKSARGDAVHPEVVNEARTACRELRLIGRSRKRERRPTAAELQQLEDHFKTLRRASIPMQDIVLFAASSARREAEICRLQWNDNDPVGRTGLVRDAKHPRSKEGNHRRFKYTPEAWEVVERQPRTSEYIFPYAPRSISAAFTRACKLLGICDLRFHDLRHEATSRLFERGYAIHEVAQFTLHESWNELKRYTQLQAKDVRDIVPAANGVVDSETPPDEDAE